MIVTLPPHVKDRGNVFVPNPVAVTVTVNVPEAGIGRLTHPEPSVVPDAPPVIETDAPARRESHAATQIRTVQLPQQ